MVENRTLTAINLTAVNLSSVGGLILSKGLHDNPVIVMLEVSDNRLEQHVEIAIATRLNVNRQKRLEAAQEAQRQAILKRKQELKDAAAAEEAERQREEALWIQEQRRLRNERRLAVAEADRKARVQAILDAREAEKKAAEDALKAAKSRKKRKGRKKKKGKGKGKARTRTGNKIRRRSGTRSKTSATASLTRLGACGWLHANARRFDSVTDLSDCDPTCRLQ